MRKTAVGTAVLCAWIWLWGMGLTAWAQEEIPAPDQPGPQQEMVPGQSLSMEHYYETLDNVTIGEGEQISFTTISPEHSGGSLPEGYYPGELTVEVTGPVTVESGGTLMIGPLSLMGAEASPVLSGAGPIVVKAGGRLRLSSVVFDTAGPGPFIIQEPGGSVELIMTQAEPGLVQWSAPLVNNWNKKPEDLWLEFGTELTEERLPHRMEVPLQTEGREEEQEVELSWDLSACGGQTEGECVLPGQFLDEAGQPLASVRPLELAVHWYTPEELVVSEAVWKGDTVPSVQLTVENMPGSVEVWGEVSADQGSTWTRWDQEERFFLVPEANGGTVCVFQLPDDTPRLFRVIAMDPCEQRYWRSRAFALQPEGSGDSEGNRGGSTTPTTPEREPEPAQRPAWEEPARQEAPAPEPEVPGGTAAEASASVEASAPPADPGPNPPPRTAGPSVSPSPQTRQTLPPPEKTAPVLQAEPPRKSQVLWVAAGAAVCTAVGVAAAKGPTLWKK